MRPTTLRFVLPALLLLGCGGGDDDDTPPPPPLVRVLFAPPSTGAPAWGTVPFPSDLYRDADGTLSRIPELSRAVPANDEIFQKALDELDGFGLTPSLAFFLDPETAPETLELPAGAVLLVDPDGGSVPVDTFYDAPEARILALPRPGVVLAEGATYVAALTTAVTGLTPDEGTRALLADRAERLGDWQAAVDRAAAVAGGREELLAVTVFSTLHATDALVRARTLVDELPAPVPHFDPDSCAPIEPHVFTRTSDPSLDDWLGETDKDADGLDLPAFAGGVAHDALALVATGTFDAVSFRRPDTRTDGPEDETFELDADGTPIPQGTEHIPFTIALPAGPPPTAAGYPLMVVQHGLNGDRSYLFAFANTAARAGIATVAIEAVAHGSRYQHDDAHSNFTGTYEGPDGLTDGSPLAVLEFFEQFTNLLAARDSFRQSSLDHTQLIRMLTSPEVDLSALGDALGTEAPAIDASRVYYAGDSLGGILGTITAAIEPRLSLAILNVPGAGVVQRVLPRAPRAVDLVEILVTMMFGATARDLYVPGSPVLALMQAILDAGDPQAYAPHLVHDRLSVGGQTIPPRDVIVIEVDRDELVSNVSTEHLARAAGLGVLTPALYPMDGLPAVASPATADLDESITGVVVQVGPAIHGSDVARLTDYRYYYPEREDIDDPWEKLPEPIEVPCPVVPLHEMILNALQTKLTGPAEVRTTIDPVADFDGDGASDDDERASGTDPFGR